jgi:replicative DNA helicase
MEREDNLLYRKGLPANLDAERYVLGSVLLNDAMFVQMAEILAPDDFTLETHRRIFGIMSNLYRDGERIDRVTVGDEAVNTNSGVTLGDLLSLDDGLPEIVNLESYIRIVKEKSTLRKLLSLTRLISERCLMAGEESSQIIESIEAALLRLAGRTASEEIISTTQMVEREGVSGLLAPPATGALKLPLPKLNEVLRGLGGGDVVVLMARTARGKSSLSYQIATSAAMQGHTPIIWTLEMSPRQAVHCIIQQLSGIWPAKNNPTLEENEELHMAVGKIYEHKLFFDDRARTIPEFIARLRRVQQKNPVGLAVVDYLQLIRSGSGRNRAQEVSDNSRALKLAAKDLNIPFVVLSQVDRASVKGDAKIGLHSGKESGDIENDADVVMWIDAEEEFSWERDTLASLTIGKNRITGRAGVKIPMIFRPKFRTFLEVLDESRAA